MHRIKHHPLYACRKEDRQCANLNAMLQKRPLVISGELFFNNILMHYAVGFFLIWTLASIRIPPRSDVWMVVLGGIAGWVVADILSYLIHMLIDSDAWSNLVSKKDTDGYAIVDGHHQFVLNYSYLTSAELISITYPIVVPVFASLCILHFVIRPGLLARSAWYAAFVVALVVTGLGGGYTHKWAHERNHNLLRDDSIIAFLQDVGIILHPRQHKGHHNDVENGERYSYSLSSGVAQIILDPILKLCRSNGACQWEKKAL